MNSAELQRLIAAAQELIADVLATGARPDDPRLRTLQKMLDIAISK
jgi:hypothetical protein